MSTYGYEIEGFIPDLNHLAEYLLRFGNSTKEKFGVDGAGIAAMEIRSQVFDSLDVLSGDLSLALQVVSQYEPDYRSFLIKWVGWHPYVLTHSLHLSMGLDNKVSKYRLYLCFYILYPTWLLYKNIPAFIRFLLRKILYSEIYRSHPDRMELRFISSEFPVESLWVIDFIEGNLKINWR